ncbi:hypothetical protein HPS54_09410 [Prevotella sp. PCHR]|uniref:Nucleotidyltransferase family protein n=2 Tax=Xylanibacter caecicola TaxID=2736294 RepID=A0ABX2B2I5_9BACT|nr:nucleotidyltransferase family protein [Xylanibacter caecicola]NPE25726.1 hypothetical protein [Xylanibacter caecicola]
MRDKFFCLIRFSVDDTVDIPAGIKPADWRILHRMAVEQALVGVLFRGIKKLPDDMLPDRELVLRWYAESESIARQNKKVNEAAVAVSDMFMKDGFRSCILKGLGNAILYPDPYMRTPGDIDIWLEGSDMEIIDYLHSRKVKGKCYYHHAEVPDFRGIPVEVHYRPSFQFNMFHNMRIQRFFRKTADIQFSNRVELPEGAGQVYVPTPFFNLIFQMSHIANHFFHEGIGLRQLMDYFFLLRQNISADDRAEFARLFKRFGMYNFASAVMYVLQEVFGLKENLLIVPADARRGRLLLNEILAAGNFGHYDCRVWHNANSGQFRKNIQRLYRNMRFMLYYPSECLCEPFFRLYHFFWRMRMD